MRLLSVSLKVVLVECSLSDFRETNLLLKGSDSVVSDAFAHDLAHRIGVPVPNHRLIWYKKGTEFKTVEKMFKKLDKNKKERFQGSYKATLQRPILFIMELVADNTQIDGLKEDLSSKQVWGRYALLNLGKILAYDMLLNNWDRFPFLWRKDQGNVGNVLFVRKSVERPLVGIDQHVTSISEPLNKEYFDKVNNVITELKGMQPIISDKSHVPILYGIIEYLRENNPKLKLGDEEFVVIVIGLLQGILSIATLTRQELQDMYDKYNNEVTSLIERMSCGQDTLGRYGLNLVDVDFLMSIIDIFKQNETELKEKEKELSSHSSIAN